MTPAEIRKIAGKIVGDSWREGVFSLIGNPTLVERIEKAILSAYQKGKEERETNLTL